MCQGVENSTVTIIDVTPSPLELLLAVHPAPWASLPHPQWRGKGPPEQIIYDARGREVGADDTDWAAALVQAINTAAKRI